MKAISSFFGNVVLDVNIDDAKPPQGIEPQQVINAVVQRYNFSNVPRTNVPRTVPLPIPGPVGFRVGMAQTGIRFQNGVAVAGDSKLPIARLEFAPDFGTVVVNTPTTEDGDVVLNDVIQLLEESCGFRTIATSSTRYYGSNVIVQFDKGIEEYLKVITELQNLIGEPMKRALGLRFDAKFQSIAFAFDPAEVPASKSQFTANFTIERRVGHLFSENRYFSSAPIQTAEHFRVLEQIEDRLRQAMS